MDNASTKQLIRQLRQSSTLYVGNLSFYTREEQIWELFSRAGEVKRVIMGLHRFSKTPCGFCFVEYVTREGAEMAMRYINRTRLDDRLIRTDWDAGFEEGRQYGRGRSGGQKTCYLLAWIHRAQSCFFEGRLSGHATPP
ncbi:unnamed protein product [Dicrocoelium dendriticum]|nr:unnamed protein product [Dicrocoelium dendriticum]